uniref:tRNA (guanine(26)-N(2))-dimethyltransferase n=1 Tax=Lotharella oceanica TaxID=641309 RepID=A0A7S2U128_9EUKA
MALVYQSLGCDAFYLQPLGQVDTSKKHPKYNQAIGPPCDKRCEFTGSRMKIAGPIWAGPLHDKEFVKKLQDHVKANPKKYKTEKKMIGQLNVVETELENPLYYDHGCLSRLFRTNYRIVQLRSAILNAGYKVSQSHANGDAIKTNAPPKVIMDIMKQIVALKPDVGKAKRGPETPAGKIMAKKVEVKADFTIVPEATGIHSAFMPNPEENWGPKARAVGGGKRKFLTAAERSKQNQGFRKKKRDEEEKRKKDPEEKIDAENTSVP